MLIQHDCESEFSVCIERPIQFGSEIAIEREKYEITQADLARESGYTISTISRIERGRHIPDMVTVYELSLALARIVGADTFTFSMGEHVRNSAKPE